MASPTIAVIGSGFSGLLSAIHLKNKLGIYTDIFEATDNIGGTWNYNTYPGCACDIPSHLYSFSFELNPNWNQKFSGQKEIQEYLIHVTKKHDLYKQVQFKTRVVKAKWLEEPKKWELELKSEGSTETRLAYYDIVFSGVGAIRVPNVPTEFRSFEGKIMHSAFWDNDYDFTNKRVAVIGSGTSSVQIIPKLQKKVTHLYSYQRTPNWVISRGQYNYPSATKFLFSKLPFLMYLYRIYLSIYYEASIILFKNPNSIVTKIAGSFFRKQMKDVLVSKDRPDLVEKLLPDISLGCKRVAISDTYLQALCEENTSVVRSPIIEIVGRTIKTADGQENEVDVLCLATGFDVNGFLGDLKIYGRDGVNLNKLWDENPTATYKTVNIHGFPNFFMLLGPGSGLGHNSVITMAEIQMNYVIKLLEEMQKSKIRTIEPKLESQVNFTDNLRKGFKGSTWTTGCKSWYLDRHGNINVLWPSSVPHFYFALKNVNMDDFDKDCNKDM